MDGPELSLNPVSCKSGIRIECEDIRLVTGAIFERHFGEHSSGIFVREIDVIYIPAVKGQNFRCCSSIECDVIECYFCIPL